MASCEYLSTFINLTIGMCFVLYKRMESPDRLSDFYVFNQDGLSSLESWVYSFGELGLQLWKWQ